MTTLHIYRGIPASGKTTAAMKATLDLGAIRVSRDDIRLHNLGRAWGVDENVVTKLFYAAMRAAFKTGLPVISDATNLQAKYVKQQIELAASHGYGFEVHDFPIDVEVAVARDAARERQVGEQVVRSFHNRFINKKTGAFPPVPAVTVTKVEFPPYVAPGPGKPHAIIVDIDGTLAHHEGHRGPYEAEKYHLDDFDQTIANLAEAWDAHHDKAHYIIVVSGRDEAYRDATASWLLDHDFEFDDLLMRPEGDRREDSIVKNELFEQHLAGRFNIDFVLDDRLRVCRMWHAKGLKILRVGDPDASF